MTDKGTRRAAFFDFDGTLIRGDSILRFLRFALGRGAVSRREVLCLVPHVLSAKAGREPMERVKERALAFEGRLSPGDRERLCGDFVREEVIPHLSPRGLETWEALRNEGARMVLVSASTDDYMVHVARALGADVLLCTRLFPDGRVGPNCRGEEKVRRILSWQASLPREEAADLGDSDAFGDSAGDLPMLRLCGRPHAVDPGRRLKKEAEKQHWPILHWR